MATRKRVPISCIPFIYVAESNYELLRPEFRVIAFLYIRRFNLTHEKVLKGIIAHRNVTWTKWKASGLGSFPPIICGIPSSLLRTTPPRGIYPRFLKSYFWIRNLTQSSEPERLKL